MSGKVMCPSCGGLVEFVPEQKVQCNHCRALVRMPPISGLSKRDRDAWEKHLQLGKSVSVIDSEVSEKGVYDFLQDQSRKGVVSFLGKSNVGCRRGFQRKEDYWWIKAQISLARVGMYLSFVLSGLFFLLILFLGVWGLSVGGLGAPKCHIHGTVCQESKNVGSLLEVVYHCPNPYCNFVKTVPRLSGILFLGVVVEVCFLLMGFWCGFWADILKMGLDVAQNIRASRLLLVKNEGVK